MQRRGETVKYKSDKQVRAHLASMGHPVSLSEEAKETPAFERAEERLGHYNLGKRRRAAIANFRLKHGMGKKV